MFKVFADFINQVKSGLEKEVARFNNKDFLEAAIASCTMVAAADGSISAEEKQKMWNFMQISPSLKVFKTDEILEFWNKHTANFEFDNSIGVLEATKAIQKLQGNTDAAKTLVALCCAVGASDGDFDDDEKAVVRKICSALGIRASEFGLA